MTYVGQGQGDMLEKSHCYVILLEMFSWIVMYIKTLTQQLEYEKLFSHPPICRNCNARLFFFNYMLQIKAPNVCTWGPLFWPSVWKAPLQSKTLSHVGRPFKYFIIHLAYNINLGPFFYRNNILISLSQVKLILFFNSLLPTPWTFSLSLRHFHEILIHAGMAKAMVACILSLRSKTTWHTRNIGDLQWY